MNPLHEYERSRRGFLSLTALGCMVAGCSAGSVTLASDPQRRFRELGIVLVVDAVPSAELEGVKFYDDRGSEFYSSSLVAKRNREILAVGGRRVPLTARIVWRENPRAVWGKLGGIDYEGIIVGDYTIPVAGRIPDEVLTSIRNSGGALRLKFRLKPDGVLFGWDIERSGGGISKFDMAGGDFLETRY